MLNLFYNIFLKICAVVIVLASFSMTAQAQEIACVYLDTPIIAGEVNDISEVTKLQYFLQKQGDTGVVINGVYDDTTIAAVNRFQVLYATDILYPWGLTMPTGDVSVTTLHKINEIHCGFMSSLSADEKDSMGEIREKYTDVDIDDDIGTSSVSLGNVNSILDGEDNKMSGTPVGFIDEFSLPILLMLFILLSVQIYFMWGVAPQRRMQLIPREFK